MFHLFLSNFILFIYFLICSQGRLSVATVERGMHTETHRRDRLFMHWVSNHGSFTALGGDLFFLFECFVLPTKI